MTVCGLAEVSRTGIAAMGRGAENDVKRISNRDIRDHANALSPTVRGVVWSAKLTLMSCLR